MENGYDYKEAKQMAGANTSVEYSDQNKNIQNGDLGAVAKPTKETLGEVLEKYLHQRRNPQRLRK